MPEYRLDHRFSLIYRYLRSFSLRRAVVREILATQSIFPVFIFHLLTDKAYLPSALIASQPFPNCAVSQ